MRGNELDERKRRYYLAGALIMALACLADWLVLLRNLAAGTLYQNALPGGLILALDRYAPLVGAATALVLAVLLWRSVQAVRLVEGVGLAVYIGVMLVRFTIMLHGGTGLSGGVALSALWFAPMYALIYVSLTFRRAVSVAVLTYAASFALGVPRLAPLVFGGDGQSAANGLFQFYLSVAAVLLLLSVHAHLRDHSVRARALAEILADEARTDFLVGLPNRRQLHQLLISERESARRDGEPACIILVDVDHFKLINDNHGHQIGDQVLVEVARRTHRCLRRTDYCGRWGGEEFMVILPGQDVLAARQVAERLQKAIACEPFAEVGTVTASFGVAELGEPLTLDMAIGQADEAMYRAKQQGRNRVEVF